MTAETLASLSAGLRDISVALTLGALILVIAVFPRGHAAAVRALSVARVASAVWVASAVAFALASYSVIGLTSPTASSYGAEVWFFVTEIPLGQLYLQIAIAAVVASVAVAFASSPVHAAWSVAPIAWALGAQSLTGHAAGAADHNLAVSGMFLHLVGSALWLGVLAGVMLARRQLGEFTKEAVSRVSRISAWAALLIVVSGAVNAWLRLENLSDLWGTGYGRLLLVKIALLAGIVALAVWHRRTTLPRLSLAEVQARFWRIMLVDVGAIVAVVVVAVVLSGTAPPVPLEPIATPTPAWTLTGYELPPAPTLATWFGLWRFEVITGLAIVIAAVTYLRWVHRLRARGDAWSPLRTASWLMGLVVLAWVTQGGPAIYGIVTFSGHMVQHMLFVMVVPVPLALGAPVTLALRAMTPRHDGSVGPREWIRTLVESRFIRFLSHPLVAAFNFSGSLVIFYYSPIFEWVLRNHVGHVWMAFHFVAAGYFFVNALVGIDPGPTRPAHPLRMILLFATMAFHAFFGVTLTSSHTLLASSWFGLMGRTWGPDAITDQQVGGQVAWGIGELPVLLLAIGVALAWRAADAKTTRRQDRQADRDHDAELIAYNAMLGEIDARDRA